MVATTLLVALLLGSLISTWQAFRATVESRRANAAEKTATDNLVMAERNLTRAKENELLTKRHLYAAEMIGIEPDRGTNANNVWNLLQSYVPNPKEADLRGFEWRALWHRYRGELFALEGHNDFVQSIAFSPDGKWLASGSNDGTARLWNLTARRQEWLYQGNEEDSENCDCTEVSFSPDGNLLLTVFLGAPERALGCFQSDGAQTGYVSFPQWENSKPKIRLSAQSKGTLVSFHLEEDRLTKFIDKDLDNTEQAGTTHGGKIWNFDSSGKGRIVTCGGDSKVKVWDATTGRLVRSLVGDTVDVLDVAFSPGGQTNRDVLWLRNRDDLERGRTGIAQHSFRRYPRRDRLHGRR